MNRSVESRADAERYNSIQWINRLPVELLSRIFLTGDELDQTDDNSEDEDDIEFQEVVVQVCRHWRTVALGIPMLWSCISIDSPPPHHRAALFLDRSGHTVPLELELDMTSDFMAGLEDYDSYSHADRAAESLAFIVAHGGTPSRWKSLKVWSELPIVMLQVIDFIAEEPLDNLHTLELIDDVDDPTWIGDLAAEALLMRDLSRSVMFHKPPPLLRNLELLGIPSDFFFADPSISLVSNLTHLELGTVPHLPPLRGLHELLLRNPRLESLFLDMSMVDQVHLSIGFPEGANINLPCLRRFALKEPRSTDWALSILRMIDAPGVEEFTLDLSHTQHPVLPGVVALYVACGRESGRLINAHFLTQRDHIHQSFPNIGPLFPVLRHLKLGAFPDDPKYLELLLRFQGSTITRLDWELEESCEGAILELAKSPAPCRRLEHLRVYGVPSDELVELVQSRISLGVPLKIIEINSRDWSSISKEVKEHLGSVLDKFGQYVDENESDSDEDSDWTDTDDEDDDNSDGSTSDSTGSEASG